MAIQDKNLVPGEWRAASTCAPNLHPFNLADVLGVNAQADVTQLQAAVDAPRKAIPAWKSAPALAYGGCVVLQPADIVLGHVLALADSIHRSGMPAGVLNWLIGRKNPAAFSLR